MRIALFGPPGAGKGTQSTLLENQFRLRPVSTGALIRSAIQEWSPLGQEASGYVSRGELVPSGLVRSLAEYRIEVLGFDQFILDGYPRTLEQAQWLDGFLDDHHSPLDAVVSLQVPDEELVERLSQRRLNTRTGETYHLTFRPPPPNVDPKVIVQRDDDTPHAVRSRLQGYHAVTEPIEGYFEDEGLLVRVDGTGPIDVVSDRLLTALSRHSGDGTTA